MAREIKNEILNQYTVEAKRQFGSSLKAVVLYGSCAREDYDDESNIDLLVLLDDTPDKLPEARTKMRSIADRVDMQYDVVISVVFQNYNIFHEYKGASGFYQNVEREGVVIGFFINIFQVDFISLK